MGLDYGAKTVGVATGDGATGIASPLETIKREKEGKLRPTLRRLAELVRCRGVGKIILGAPINMDDTKGERYYKTLVFRDALIRRLEFEGLDTPVVMWDERLSTVSADEVLEEAGVRREDRKLYVDKIAASFILEDYMKNGGVS